MDLITERLGALNGVVWGVPMLVGILGVGLYMQIRLGFCRFVNWEPGSDYYFSAMNHAGKGRSPRLTR